MVCNPQSLGNKILTNKIRIGQHPSVSRRVINVCVAPYSLQRAFTDIISINSSNKGVRNQGPSIRALSCTRQSSWRRGVINWILKLLFIFFQCWITFKLEEQNNLRNVPGTCVRVTVSCPQMLSWTTSPFITSTVGSLDAEAEQGERLIGFTSSALTAQAASGDKTYPVFTPHPSHTVARWVWLWMAGRCF